MHRRSALLSSVPLIECVAPLTTVGGLSPARRVACTLESEMPTCKACGEEADELQTVKVDGKTKKLCESCADEVREQGAVAEASEAAVQNMMGFKGRR